MVVCKYFQQGSCRFGQYCRYEHINNYGANANRSKPFDGKNITLLVAEDVLAAERGGQWLLSCFGPFKEQQCIPGMSDLSPEEVRWEMYQAEKKGNVEQVKIHFQQLCQDMKAKRDALKNPTPQLVTMLENLQKSSQESTFGASPTKSSFSFATPQLGSTTPTSNSNVFGGKSFGTSGNPFGGNYSSTTGNSIFGGSSTTNSGSVFGSKPAFGNNSVFGTTPSTTSLFGGSSTPAFATQTTQSFGTSQSSSIFGGGVISPPVFGQASAFGTSQNNSFLRPASTVSTTSVFGNNANNTFGNSAPPSFGNPGIFGNGAKTSAFGSTSTSGFGSTTTTPAFGSTTTTSAFGGAPVFGGTSAFGATQSGSIFGGQSAFGSAPATSNSIFGGSTTNTFNTATPGMNIFGAGTQAAPFGGGGTAFGQSGTAAPFGQPAMGVNSSFGQTTNAEIPFGATTTATGASFGTTVASGTPFGQPNTTGTPFGQSAPFSSTSGPFGTATTAPFSQTAPFGQTVTSTDSSSTFGTTDSMAAPLASGFGVPVTAPPPFGSQINFGSAITSPFPNTNTTVTTVTSNPFTSASKVTGSPFINLQTNQNTFVSSGPFTKSTAGFFSLEKIFDELTFTDEGVLTEDQKNCYFQSNFILGKIPLKAPTKELR